MEKPSKITWDELVCLVKRLVSQDDEAAAQFVLEDLRMLGFIDERRVILPEASNGTD